MQCIKDERRIPLVKFILEGSVWLRYMLLDDAIKLNLCFVAKESNLSRVPDDDSGEDYGWWLKLNCWKCGWDKENGIFRCVLWSVYNGVKNVKQFSCRRQKHAAREKHLDFLRL